MFFDKDEPFDFTGDYYRVKQAIILPRPQRIGGPPILIGGIGKKRSLPLAASYADEWNAMFLKPNEFKTLNLEINKSLSSIGRDPKSLKRSMMTGLRYAKTQEELEAKLNRTNQSAEELRSRGIIVGVGDEIQEQLLKLEQAGLERIMLQWLDLDNMDGLRELARTIL